ncbi:MAG: TonB-dependent receptor [Deltaproteobacteria bacterium]|nr:TonB-dependent receptor [Deltaproteobacteria bacterium]
MLFRVRSFFLLFFLLSLFVIFFQCEVFAESSALKDEAQVEQLLWGDAKITSAAKREQTIKEVGNSMSIITREDIIASGATTLPDLFAFVPGVQLFFRNANEPEVSIRGLPKQYSSKILVLVDGVSVYSPFTSGVFWYSLPVTVDSIERIEIIRGPSSVLYGANAFFGVINIITRRSEDMKGVEAKVYGGNLGYYGASSTLLYPIGERAHFRFSGEYFQSKGYGSDNGEGIDDDAITGTLMADGFLKVNEKSNLELGVWYRRSKNELPTNNILPAARVYSDNIYGRGRFTTNFNESNQFTISSFFNRRIVRTPDQPGVLNANQTTEAELRLEHLWDYHNKNYLTVGGDYRYNGLSDTTLIEPSFESEIPLHMASFYLNDEFRPLENVILTGGARYDYDSFSKHNWSARFNVSYLPHPDHVIRASIARGFRNINYYEEKGEDDFPFGPAQVSFRGDPDTEPETMIGAEFGYLGNFLNGRLRLNVDFYYNDVNDLILLQLAPLAPGEFLLSPTNVGDVSIYGLEYGIKYRVFDWWDFTFDHSFLHQSNDNAGRGPSHMINIGNRFNTSVGFSANIAFNWISDYRVVNVGAAKFYENDDLFRLDVRLAQKFLKDRLEFAVVGQGLVDYPRIEFEETLRTDRRIFGTLTYYGTK